MGNPWYQLPLWMGQVLGEMVLQGLGGRWYWKNEVGLVGLEHSSAQKLAGLVSSAGEGAGPIRLSEEKPVQPH